MSDIRVTRRREVLKAVVRAYVATGEPVGSRAVSGSSGCEFSSATVRTVMAELEELGYLTQPHTSAGRLPTESGYRLYADLVLAEWREQPWPRQATAAGRLDATSEMPEFLVAASRALSSLCGCVGLVLRPRLADVRFRHAHFVRLDPKRVVMVVIGERGLVVDRVVPVELDHGQEELDRISSTLVNRFSGLTLGEVRGVLARELSRERAAYDAAVTRWMSLALSCLEGGISGEDVYVEGAAQCLGARIADLDAIRQLLRAYEQKDAIRRLLESCLDGDDVQVHIGAEALARSGVADLDGLALVAATYGDGERPLGSVGVLGPTRMEYARVIAVVDDVARQVSSAMRRPGSRLPA